MIRLFVTDIDGCLATPYQPFRLDVLSQIRTHALSAGLPDSQTIFPSISICSGRAYPYVEAMSQLLHLNCPVLFESGAGLFDPVRMHCYWHPGMDAATEEGMEEIKRFVLKLAEGTELSVDLAKRSQVAVVAPERRFIEDVYPAILSFVESTHPGLQTFMTPFSIDIVAPHLTKKAGVAWLAELCEVKLSEMAFVGDSEGDIGALEIVGRSFAPANADTSVKAVVDVTTVGSDADGVLEAYLNVVEFNECQNRQTHKP